jgi:hypothetical protein
MANSTIMFQGLDPNAKLSSKVLRPPGGGSSDIFGIHDSKGTNLSIFLKEKSACFIHC